MASRESDFAILNSPVKRRESRKLISTRPARWVSWKVPLTVSRFVMLMCCITEFSSSKKPAERASNATASSKEQHRLFAKPVQPEIFFSFGAESCKREYQRAGLEKVREIESASPVIHVSKTRHLCEFVWQARHRCCSALRQNCLCTCEMRKEKLKADGKA